MCALYGSKKDSVDSTRFDMIMKKQTRENKAIDHSAIPPCFSSLYLQIQRANFVAATWKRTESAQISLPNINENGWHTDGTINWNAEPYPEDISDLLLQENEDSCENSESENAIYE